MLPCSTVEGDISDPAGHGDNECPLDLQEKCQGGNEIHESGFQKEV
jgi:hypothetical protein